MDSVRKPARLASVALAAAALSLTGLSAAHAEPATHGCAYPYVCFYVDEHAYEAGTPITKYRDVTSSYQTVRSRPHYHVVNTRNDDVAHLRLQDGSSICLPPNTETVFSNAYSVTGIRISTSSTC
ncbi:hypothetical protein AQJ30_24905 [Streptomyces longwoodensis]|uniref:Peptidase inhibitor family I36 n=1 Tax=Streptomyces longwoodensis TaxID=68231 RepID=A0A101QSV0_9ACTN|nr:hypothetical protein [Streptomyces longwoodensis]KUN35388.1 hypothetical protein AQJ30_24905 [Streptomyces longwoodensis]